MLIENQIESRECRTLKMFIGDWSCDGHEKFDEIIVKISGKDVSDEVLRQAYQKSVDEFEHDLFESFKEYEESSIDADLFFSFVNAGFDPERMESSLYAIAEDGEFDPVALMMWYIGRSIEDFEWDIVKYKYPTLIGGHSSILSDKNWERGSFGYGLYH